MAKPLAKRRRRDAQPLLPGLPDHTAHLCLSRVPPSLLFSVCRSWLRLIYSPSFPPFLSLYTIFTSSTPSPDHYHSDSLQFLTFDPISSTWDPLPPPPRDPPLRLLLRHPSFISRNLPVQSISISGNLVILAASTHNLNPALSQPLIFNPLTRSWTFGPRLATPRRWCAAGALRGSVYVGSGIGSQFSTDVAKSWEKWDLHGNKMVVNRNHNHHPGWGWEKRRGLKDGRFCRDAVDAVGWRGKLCMVNVRGDAAKEGVVYDVEKDVWEEMPEGMLAGWRGPAAAMDEDVMYVVDESKGALIKYVQEEDRWEQIMESDRLRGAQQMAAGGGKVCVVIGEGEIVVVDAVAASPRLWVVERPPGLEAVAVHVLPRMSRPEFEDRY